MYSHIQTRNMNQHMAKQMLGKVPLVRSFSKFFCLSGYSRDVMSSCLVKLLSSNFMSWKRDRLRIQCYSHLQSVGKICNL